jgi:hypothetical protein
MENLYLLHNIANNIYHLDGEHHHVHKPERYDVNKLMSMIKYYIIHLFQWRNQGIITLMPYIHTHTHTHTHIYIYIYIYVCVRVCVRACVRTCCRHATGSGSVLSVQ